MFMPIGDRRRFLCAAVVLLLSQPLLIGSAHQVDQREIAERIRRPSRVDRVDAVASAARIPTSERSDVLHQALADELTRLNAIAQRLAAAPPDFVASEADFRDLREDYYGVVVQLNAESGSPIAQDALIGALGTGNMAIRAVARYGSPILPRLTDVLLDPLAIPGARTGASRSISILIAERRLDANQLRAVAKATATVLGRPERSVVVSAVIELAVKTGDRPTIELVEEIAKDPTVARLSDTDSSRRLAVQRSAVRALESRPKV